MEQQNNKTIETYEQLFKDAIQTFGEKAQISMFFEEAAELQELLAKLIRGRKVDNDRICEEVADVLLVVFQLMEIFGQKDVWLWFDYKTRRLKESIEKAKEKKEQLNQQQ